MTAAQTQPFDLWGSLTKGLPNIFGQANPSAANSKAAVETIQKAYADILKNNPGADPNQLIEGLARFQRDSTALNTAESRNRLDLTKEGTVFANEQYGIRQNTDTEALNRRQKGIAEADLMRIGGKREILGDVLRHEADIHGTQVDSFSRDYAQPYFADRAADREFRREAFKEANNRQFWGGLIGGIANLVPLLFG